MAKQYDTSTGGAEQARIDTLELAIDNTVQIFAEKCRRHDAGDVQRVARMFTVRDSVGDQSRLILDPMTLGKVNHRVDVVLLRTRIRAREEPTDPVYPCQLHAGVVVRRASAAAYDA